MQKLNSLYAVNSTLFENTTTIIYNATRREDGRKVILKTHKRPEDVYKIKHEFTLLKGLDVAGVSNVIDIFNNNEDPVFLVSEDRGAVVLEDYIKTREITEEVFLRITESAARALAAVHAQKIIHRDIKPSNMMVHPETLEVYYIDFGISVQAKRGFELHQQAVEGTLEYLPPEQTGRVNKAVDYRSDIYSLGVVLYRMLTGRLPFAGNTAMELIHAHIAITPMAPAELVDIHPVISAGVMKMLEKKPEDRYQTASSVLYDIALFNQLCEQGRDCNAMRLGEKDIFFNLEPGNKMYGNSEALQRLQDVFDGISGEYAEIVLLDGATAVGKSMLLDEAERYAVRGNGMVFRGDYQVDDRDNEPYRALRRAFEEFEALAYSSRVSLSAYIEQVQQALGNNGQVLLDILPRMEQILGKQQEVPALDVRESQVRMQQVFRVFLQVVCEMPFPCVFLFDNVQWADEASLRLLFAALDNPQLGNCMFVFCCRPDEEGTARLRADIQKLNLRHKHLHEVKLQPMDVAGVEAIIQDVFPQEESRTRELARLVYNQTGGSIRAIERYLKSLYRQGTVYFDDEADEWVWDEGRMDAAQLRGYDAQLSRQYSTMQEETLAYLRIFACMGTEATRAQVDIIFGAGGRQDKAQRVDEVLAPAVKAGIFCIDAKTGSYYFDSDRARAVLYNDMPPGQREELHHRVVSRLLEAYEGDETSQARYCTLITEQLALSGELATDVQRREVLRINYMSAEKAMQSGSMERAARLYEAVLRLSLGFEATQEREEYIRLRLNLAACKFALGCTEEGVALYQQVAQEAQNEDERFEAYKQLVRRHLQLADWETAERYAREYLADTGLLPQQDTNVATRPAREYARYLENVRRRDIDVLLAQPLSKDAAVWRGGWMLAILGETSKINMSMDAGYFICRAVNYAYENGVYPGFERALALLSERCANNGEYARARQVFEWGVAFAEKHKQPQSVLWAMYCSVILHWVEPLDKVPEVYQRARHIALAEGDLYYGAFADLMLLGYHLFTGTPLTRVLRDVDAAIYTAEKANFGLFDMLFASCYRQFVRCMTGRTKSASSFDDRQFNEAELESASEGARLRFNAQFYCVYRMQALFINGFYGQVLEYAERLLTYTPDEQMLSAFIVRVPFYYYYSMAMIRLCEQNSQLIKACMPIIRHNQTHLKAFAEAQPENFGPHYRLVELELRRITEFDLELISYYSEVELDFKNIGCEWDRAIVEETMLEFWRGRDIPQYQEVHSQNSLAIYRHLGARIKVLVHTARGEGESFAETSTAPASFLSSVAGSTGFSLSTDTADASSLDYQAILNVISCLASEKDLDALNDELLGLLMKNGGAEQALLFLVRGDEIVLQAFRYSDRYTQGLISHQVPVELAQVSPQAAPHKLVTLCASKRMQLVANSSDNELGFLGDEYLESHKPESFICLPVVAKGELLGVLYLENAHLPGIFPPQRVNFLNAIVLQAAFLLQNALDVQNMGVYTEDLEKRLNSYIAQLNTLIAGIAHEVNSPLGVCVTVATRLQEQLRETQAAFLARQLSKQALERYLDTAGEGLDILTANVTRAGNLVQNFKKIAVDQSNEVFEDLEMLPTLRSIVEYIRPAVKRAIGSFEINGPEDLQFYSSPGALAQIFTNLVMNSALHAFDGISRNDCRVTIEVAPMDDGVRIVYTDNGKGMTEEEKEKIFVPFFTTSRKEGGSGLGGHIILSLVTQTLGGSIQCLSTPGQGTSFVMLLPDISSQEQQEKGKRHG